MARASVVLGIFTSIPSSGISGRGRRDEYVRRESDPAGYLGPRQRSLRIIGLNGISASAFTKICGCFSSSKPRIGGPARTRYVARAKANGANCVVNTAYTITQHLLIYISMIMAWHGMTRS
ncbi:hypothetical protein DFH94DRAFT_684735 [Russula ochroleuca]|uniref:Uncharacterized protein n=1 Tax=Russula ochroleuca TaxID=152965 RepID=A0A9P5JZ23_9AGAM|nr:hypothetical protein DFH94DRAFT_686925 [Russula ochroleuca]KAF8471568.1 hypothetical protein DFH94DRAFT_684735 [Russula ochroleuca]